VKKRNSNPNAPAAEGQSTKTENIGQAVYMSKEELRQIYESIEGAVGQWLSKQDQLTRAIHASGVDLRQLGANDDIDTADADYAALCHKIRSFLTSDFPELSGILTRLYQDFNVRYFNGALPSYKVIAKHDLGSNYPNSAQVDGRDLFRDKREIVMAYDGQPLMMISWLLYIMAHIDTEREYEAAANAAMQMKAAVSAKLQSLNAVGAPTGIYADALQYNLPRRFVVKVHSRSSRA